MIVVTGGAGFIGSALIWQLNLQGIEDIVVVDHLGSGQKWRNLVKRRYDCLLPKEEFRSLMAKDQLPEITAIVHLGACSSTTETDCDYLYDNNFRYSQEVCTYAIKHHIRCLVASSAATYGDGRLGFEEEVLATPLNMYGYSKLLLDQWLIKTGAIEKVASLRFFNVYGPNEYHKGAMRSVVAKAYAAINESGVLELFRSTVPHLADGEQKRDFVYVKDCTAVMAWLLQNPSITGIYNVGTGEAHSFNELGRAIFRAMNKPEHLEYIPMPENLVATYQSYTCADMSWCTRLAPPITFTPLERGVSDYVTQYLAKPDPYL